MYNTQPISGSKTVPSNWKEAQISAIFKVSPSGPFVKTLLKKFASISAFSLSSSVLAEFGLL
jgi:6-phosphogluconolactonase (cycloisomerase 2 family)